MIDAMADMTTGDLPPVLDVEVTDSESARVLAPKIDAWVAKVQAGTGVMPVIYSGSYFWRDQVNGSKGEETSPFWIAQYTSKCPNLPLPWQRWALWQYSSTGTVAGISGHVDMDKFNGTLDDLRALGVH
jgi:lysozyme